MSARMSRFPIHDELTAPERSAVVLRGALSGGGQLPNFLGVLAGSPAALRAYARFRSELRHGTLSLPTVERIALAVAEQLGSEQEVATHARSARAAGLGGDEIELARRFRSQDPGEAALLEYVRAIVVDGRLPLHLHEQAREAGWSEEQLLEAIAFVSLEHFVSMVSVAAEIPPDGSSEHSRLLKAA